MASKIMVIGASGQIGTELTLSLRNKLGNNNVIACDIHNGSTEIMESGPFEIADATNFEQIKKLVDQYEVAEVYLMAAMLSATAEKFPKKAWELNMNSLFNVLDLAKEKKIHKVFWPSSIAVFGSSSPKQQTPQSTVMEPSTVYGISKLAGERWCEYYHRKFGVDVRSVRYPGLISYKIPPGGGTTDYAIEIFIQALEKRSYTSFLKEDTELPMMFMDDAINGTISLMTAPSKAIKTRSSYNLSALNFSPKILAEAIKKHIPGFTIDYDPDFRQAIADSWPSSIDDSEARQDWGWKPQFDIDKMTLSMLKGLREKQRPGSGDK